MDWRKLAPKDIERRSMEIIESELGEVPFEGIERIVLKRVIHTTADFGYAENLFFSPDAAQKGIEALIGGADIVTDTNMAKSGINKAALAKLGCRVHCFMADERVAEKAAELGVTRVSVSMEAAAEIDKPLIIAVGNAPTALLRLAELINEKRIEPKLIIAAPVGFVNVVESKRIIEGCGVPVICARGRKGGSSVAAAICNALAYEAVKLKD